MALYDSGDSAHRRVAEEFNSLQSQRVQFVTTSDIFDETVTLVRSRVGHRKAVEAGHFLRTSLVWRVRPVDHATREAAWDLFRKYEDHEFSLTDCTSFITMKTYNLRDAFTLDSDFKAMGFVTRPRP
ncbi:MAG: PilT-like [Planctomycetota bacterium]|nr:MAG: PilT-like [Planctomycetota bacterium]